MRSIFSFFKHAAIAAVVLALVAGSVQATSIDVLFYGASPSWNNALSGIAATAHTYDPWGDGSNQWNASFWNAGDPTPSFSDYDVLFIPSPAVFGSGMDPARLLAAKADLEAARGSRTFLTGQDADWHYIFSPGPIDDGPRGFMINAVNWAASGTGLGIVSMTDGWQGSNSQWWLHPDSFLRDELNGYVQYFQNESVMIGPGQDTFPVNEGLTSAGLSNWGVSSHSGFDPSILNYATINFELSGGLGRAITIVTLGEEAGETIPSLPGGEIPEPSTLLLLGTGLLGMVGYARRR